MTGSASLAQARRHVGTRVLWCAIFAVAMAYVEAAVVVYLRALGPADGPLAALQTVIPPHLRAAEVWREAATIVMLVAVAALAGRGRWERFLVFALCFGIWDIFYYAWLRVLIGWPASLLTWDVLFLIPVPWVAPVLAPVLVSAGLVGGSLWLLARGAAASGAPAGLPRVAWLLAGAGAALILLSFTIDARAALIGGAPPPFRWWLFGIGLALGAVAPGVGTKRGSNA